MPIRLPAMPRRRFLAGSLAAGAGLLMPRRLLAGESVAPRVVDPNCWALLADVHIRADRQTPHRGVLPAEKLAAVVARVVAEDPLPFGAIICGDCAYMQGEVDDYRVLGELIAPLADAGMAVYLLLGNHDHREHLHEALPGAAPAGDSAVESRHVAVVESTHADLFLLDSLDRTDHTPGLLGDRQRAWLAEQLDARIDRPAIVLAHHYLNHGEGDTRITTGLQDTGALLEILLPRRRVKAFFFGHSHRWSVARHEDLHLVNVPAVAWLFDARQPRGWVDLRLSDDGASLRLRTIDRPDDRAEQPVELAWRAAAAPAELAPTG